MKPIKQIFLEGESPTLSNKTGETHRELLNSMRKRFDMNEQKALKNLLFSQNSLEVLLYNFTLKFLFILFNLIFRTGNFVVYFSEL